MRYFATGKLVCVGSGKLDHQSHLGNGKMATCEMHSLQQACHIMVHVIKNHINTAFLIVALVAFKSDMREF